MTEVIFITVCKFELVPDIKLLKNNLGVPRPSISLQIFFKPVKVAKETAFDLLRTSLGACKYELETEDLVHRGN